MRTGASFALACLLLFGGLAATPSFSTSELLRLPFPPVPRGLSLGSGRFFFEGGFYSGFTTSRATGAPLAAADGLFLATLGYAFNTNAVLRVTLGYDLFQWNTGSDARWGQGLSWSNLRGVSFSLRTANQWAFHMRYGQDQAAFARGFSRFFSQDWMDDSARGLFLPGLDTLSLGVSKSFLGDKLQVALQVTTPELGLRREP